jgi:hypothetical protein
MPFWLDAETPNISSTARLSTNLPGSNDTYEFDDQADAPAWAGSSPTPPGTTS